MNFLASNPGIDPGTAALVGYTVLAVGALAAALIVAAILRKILGKGKKTAVPVVIQTPPEPAPAAPSPTAPGSAGQLKLHDVEPKTAAMLMAIVADKMGKPLNELRFISIKEVK